MFKSSFIFSQKSGDLKTMCLKISLLDKAQVLEYFTIIYAVDITDALEVIFFNTLHEDTLKYDFFFQTVSEYGLRTNNPFLMH